MVHSKSKNIVALFVCLTFVVLVGCGDPPPPTGDLSGKVMNGGELVGDCIVSLYNPTTKRSLGGKVNLEGNFEITAIPLGTYEISLGQRTTNDPNPEPFDERIPKKYRDAKTSGFSVTIEEGQNSISLEMNE